MSYDHDGYPRETRKSEDEALLIRILQDLCNAKSNDARTIAAVQLQEAVENLDVNVANSEVDHPAINTLNERLLVLLTSEPLEVRLGAIGVVRLLLSGEAESLDKRARRARDAFRVLFHTRVTDMRTAEAAVKITEDLNFRKRQECDLAIKYLLNVCVHRLKDASDTSTENDSNSLAVIAMVISHLCVYIPGFIFRYSEDIRQGLWRVVVDESRIVREKAVLAMQAVVNIVVDRKSVTDGTSCVDEVLLQMLNYMQNAMDGYQNQRAHFNESTQMSGRSACNLHGVLLLLSSLIEGDGTRGKVEKHFSEFCQFILPLQRCADVNVREAVALVLPEVVRLRKKEFVSKLFLEDVHKTTIELVTSEKLSGAEKGRWLESLGKIAKEVGGYCFKTYLGDVLTLCDVHLSKNVQDPSRIPQKHILSCIMHLAMSSHGSQTFEHVMHRSLLKKVFQSEFTHALVLAVCEIQRAIPSLASTVEVRLIHTIATTLRRGKLQMSQGDAKHSVRPSLAIGVPNELGRMMGKGGLDLGNALQAANVIDDVFQGSWDGAQSTQLFSQTTYVSMLGNIAAGVNAPTVGSYGSSFESPYLGGKDGLHSFLQDRKMFDVDVSERALDVDLRNDKAQSPCVALKAICHYTIFNMRAGDISLFTKEFVADYLEHANVKVRYLSVQACAQLAKTAVKSWTEMEQGGQCIHRLRPDIHKIISKIVALAVTDPSPDVRATALSVLDEEDDLHPYLLQPLVLKRLFLCLYDENNLVRLKSLAFAGRLCKSNPAHVAIPLRKLLAYILRVLKTKGLFLAGLRKECTGLLSVFVQEARSAVDPYAEPIMLALISRLKVANAMNDRGAAVPVLKAIGELGGLSSAINLHMYSEQLTPMIVYYILDDTSSDSGFCKIAIHALYKFVQCTGYVIEPYEKFPKLLPGLLRLMNNEMDRSMRLEIETLLGCLGAVDPSNHKDASLPSLAGSSHELPRMKSEQSTSRARGKPSNSSSVPRSFEGKSFVEGRVWTSGPSRKKSPLLQAPTPINPDFPDTAEIPVVSADLFAVGPERLKTLLEGYTPVWLQREHQEISLVGRLEHPFTTSPDYLPSIALDKLIALARNANRRQQNRNAFDSIVKIVSVYVNSCFLDVVFPCFLWALRPEYSTESKQAEFGGFEDYVMARVTDLVSVGGSDVEPYVFDTVLLMIRYVEETQFAPKCMVAVCKLLGKIRLAIGDDRFSPVLGTVLSLFLEALGEEHRQSETVIEAVLLVMQSWGSLLRDSSAIVLGTIVSLVETANGSFIQARAMGTLLTLLSDAPLEHIISIVVHPLLRLLAISDISQGKVHNYSNSKSSFSFPSGKGAHQPIWRDLCDDAALALAIIAHRAPGAFKVFVPVVSKTLLASTFDFYEESGKKDLIHVLFQFYHKVVGPIFRYSVSDVNLLLSSPVSLRGHSWENIEAIEVPVLEPRIDPRVVLDFEDGDAPPLPPAIDQQHAQTAEGDLLALFEIRDDFSNNEWERWRTNLEVGLMKYSGSIALNACIFMFDNNPNIGRSLFNAAFLSCWSQPEGSPHISNACQERITMSLLHALQSESMPMNVTQLILNLFEFMEHDEKPLPASVTFLADRAYRCGVLAKALRYKEGEYASTAKVKACPNIARSSLVGDGGLLAIYDKLGHEESHTGTTQHYEKIFKIPFNEHMEGRLGVQTHDTNLEMWAKQLGEWENVSDGQKPIEEDSREEIRFEILNEESVSSPRWSFLLKKLQNLNDMGKWRATDNLLKKAWDVCDGNLLGRRKLAVDGKGISVAFDLSNWEEFEDRISYLNDDEFLGPFYRALNVIHRGTQDPKVLDEAEKHLSEARQQLDIQLTARLNEGYPRAYLDVVHVQTLVELEEMVSFLRLPKRTRTLNRARIKHMWRDRLDGCKYDQYIWYRVLMIRSLVLTPHESKDQWIEFSALCRKSDRMPLASEALRMLVIPSVSSYSDRDRVEDMSIEELKRIPDLETRYAVCKHLWTLKRRSDAFQVLHDTAAEYKMAADPWVSRGQSFSYEAPLEPRVQSYRAEVALAAEVMLKTAKWSHRLANRGVTDANVSHSTAISFAFEAIEMRPSFYKPWHWWAQFNNHMANALMHRDPTLAENARSRTAPARAVLTRDARGFLKNAVEGYFRAIRVGGKTGLQDALKILTMWFKYGNLPFMQSVFDNGFEHSVVTGWLQVIPQIIARLQPSQRKVQHAIEQLLVRIGNAHPQMAVYSLIVAKTMPGEDTYRRQASTRVLSFLKRKHHGVVSQAEMVAHELVRVAILWSEKWFEALDEASRLYFAESDVQGMLQIVLPLHELLEKGPQTSYEKAFVEMVSKDLRDAREYLNQIQEGLRRGLPLEHLRPLCTTLWELYYMVYGHIQGHQKLMTTLDLSKVSQQLRHASDMDLAVPGTYDPAVDEVVRIHSFSAQLHIILSKQRPRKLSILGSNGKQYEFLLKGHEDLRQDERVMQVFGLINQILSRSHIRSLRSGADIERYAVIALSSDAGLIEWVPNCDTIHSLVKDHRTSRNVIPNVEHRVMLRVAPEPDRLPMLCKVDIFKFMLENTSGSDISRVLWLKSRSSEVWLDRRTTYARSLAVSSMAGYLLGLGDRHPSNVMMDRGSGKIMHIDFGDCFEVALARDKYPEKVPFRLTRMLIHALEPCGVDGYFRHTCEAVVRLLRHADTADSVMCMMEAFVHDPLLRMKLVGGEELQRMKDDTEMNGLSAMDEIMNNTVPPLLSTSLRVEHSNAIKQLMEAGSLEGAFLHQQLLHSNADVPDEPAAGGVQVPGVIHHEFQQAGLVAPSPSTRSRRDRDRLLSVVPEDKSSAAADRRAAIALKRVRDKLNGLDFGNKESLSVHDQVDKLIEAAQNVENLCSLYAGWCAFW